MIFVVVIAWQVIGGRFNALVSQHYSDDGSMGSILHFERHDPHRISASSVAHWCCFTTSILCEVVSAPYRGDPTIYANTVMLYSRLAV